MKVVKALVTLLSTIIGISLLSISVVQAQSTTSVRFATVGDYGTASTAAGDVAAVLDTWNPDFIAALGDIRYSNRTYGQTTGQFYCNYLKDVENDSFCAGGTSSVNRFFPGPGNHDYDDGGGINQYLDYFNLPGAGVVSSNTSGSEHYYDVIIGPVHIFVLDSDSIHDQKGDYLNQITWLETQLLASTTPWQVVVMHHPAYSSSTVHGSDPSLQLNYAAWGADAIFAGHDHTYERIERNGIQYFVNGLGGQSTYGIGTPISGSQFQYNGDNGFMIVDATETTMNFKFINTSGNIIDDYTIDNEPPNPNEGVINVQVSQSSDDAEQLVADGSMYINSSDLELVFDDFNGGDQLVGIRFQSVDIPAEATITNAYLEFTVDEADSGSTSVDIKAQDSDSPSTFTLSTNNIGARPVTAAVAWSNIPAWTSVGSLQQTPDLSSIVQTVVNRTGWSPGNSMAFVISGSGERTAESFDGSAAILLHVEYSTEPLPNVAPTASFVASCTDLDCSFDASSSSDSDGTIVAYDWDLGNNVFNSGQSISHSYIADNTYEVTLTVTDDDGETGSTTQSVTVSSPLPNVPPSASFTFSCNFLDCSFNGSSSTDSDGSVDSFSWSFGASGANAANSFSTAGTYPVTLTVTDNEGASDAQTQNVTVIDPPPNQVPTASFTFNCTDLDCNFDASGSSDSDGSVVSYSWSFGASGVNALNSFSGAGTYAVTLSVTDNDGDSDTQTQNVTVTDPPPSPITLNLAPNNKGNKVIITWSGANGSKIDIYKNGSFFKRDKNDGNKSDKNVNKGETYTYQICEQNSVTLCSSILSITL